MLRATRACMRCTVTQLARESVGLCPFRGSYVFKLVHIRLLRMILKTTGTFRQVPTSRISLLYVG